MNIEIVKSYIEEYKRNFESGHNQEIYKWHAIKQFQDNFDVNAKDFYANVELSLNKGPAWQDDKISEAFDVTVQTVERIRKQFVEEGFDAVLSRHEYKQKVSRKKIDGHVAAHLIALSCSEPPHGRARWTLRLLADKIVELGYIDDISYEAVRQT